MTPRPLALDVLGESLAICRLAADAPIPAWATSAPFWSVTRTASELSIVCAEARVPAEVEASGDWRALRLAGPFDLAEVGVLARVAVPLADAGVAIMPIATYETDYVLVRAAQLPSAIAALRAAGHEVRAGDGAR